MPRVAHLTGSLSRLAGGPFESVRRLAQESDQMEPGCVRVLGNIDTYWTADQAHWNPVAVEALRVLGPHRFGYKPSLPMRIWAFQPDVLHVHGLWTYASVAAIRWARHTGKPRIISPRGMLEPWAWAHHNSRKLLLWKLFEQRHCSKATVIHATSDQEASAIAERVPGARVVVIPNGVDVTRQEDLYPLRAKRGSQRRALFLSRIHPKKGLMPLLEAWSALRPEGWNLTIAGMDEGGHLAEVQSHAKHLKIQHLVTFLGPQHGSAKLATYASADLFVLPTHSENFGMVVAEALAAGVPVLTTRGTPWSQLPKIDAGWWIPLTPSELKTALADATSKDRVTLDAMGARGRTWASQNLSWQSIAGQFSDLYASIQ